MRSPLEDFDEHDAVLREAMALYKQRDEQYGDAWRRSGAYGQAMRARDKVARVVGAVESGGRWTEDALDAINHLTFAIRCQREGNMTGDEPRRFNSFCSSKATMLSGCPPDTACILHEGHELQHIGRDSGNHIWTWR